MDPINWAAVALSSTLAVLVGMVWYGPLFRRATTGSLGMIVGAVALQGISALMLGHALARIGVARLAVKPWLFWMQTGGIALAFIIPALWMSYARLGVARREGLIDAGFWLVVYLLTGTVFWAFS